MPERSADDQMRLLSDSTNDQLENWRHWRAERHGQFPYPIFPEPGGLLPWGDIRGGGVAFWLTERADPDGWPVVVTSHECEYWDRFDGTVCEFPIGIAAGRYDANGFTEGPTMDETGVVDNTCGRLTWRRGRCSNPWRRVRGGPGPLPGPPRISGYAACGRSARTG